LIRAAFAGALLLAACGGSGSAGNSTSSSAAASGATTGTGGATSGSTSTTTTTSTSTSTTSGGGDKQNPPAMGGMTLQDWLSAKNYAGWHAESMVHDSAGPHFGKARVFVNDVLFAHLGKPGEHPQGSAAVKELYGNSNELGGWSVSIKLAPTSNGGADWYWFELFLGNKYTDAKGAKLCTDCHVAGQDFFLSSVPLK
jgi:hypothetical protein